ncbi:uncharacterized protein TRUGW13939_08831 [Talaromyces rugulosus]|uniref:DUF6570 domain-containing protein n=1 Tax=Talaromyces rugulosus TaxID=121627 RepID=A0A7H8R6U3_TALRU|nr:uncharacterized protein TRUGW13939_08831 [Talaromyces rugulosus]QKX61678.1 hypothetical protein TRUGW13939_08831 [Talaromyces rugulosus]
MMTSMESQRATEREQRLLRVPHDDVLQTLQRLDCQRSEQREASLKRRREQAPLPTPSPTQFKRQRLMSEVVQRQRASVDSLVQGYDARFHGKARASATRSWCKEVPLSLQVKAAKSFYEAFTNENTLPIAHCVLCYEKRMPCELTAVEWKYFLTPSVLQQATTVLQQCAACFPRHNAALVQVCRGCRTDVEDGRLPKACSVNNMDIGCEHRYPEELDDLSPVEERLIALHTPFGCITKFTVDNKTPSGMSYRKHVKGHIVVFPNKVEDLVATVLPHPLLQAIENIHISADSLILCPALS